MDGGGGRTQATQRARHSRKPRQKLNNGFAKERNDHESDLSFSFVLFLRVFAAIPLP
jgi:hypothetical protein